MLVGLVDDDDLFSQDVAKWTAKIPRARRPTLRVCSNQESWGQLAAEISNKKAEGNAIILLDLDIDGRKDAGLEILAQLRKSKNAILRRLPVIIYSNSMNSADVDKCYSTAANSYVWKGVGMSQKKRYLDLVHYWQKMAALPNCPATLTPA